MSSSIINSWSPLDSSLDAVVVVLGLSAVFDVGSVVFAYVINGSWSLEIKGWCVGEVGVYDALLVDDELFGDFDANNNWVAIVYSLQITIYNLQFTV